MRLVERLPVCGHVAKLLLDGRTHVLARCDLAPHEWTTNHAGYVRAVDAKRRRLAARLNWANVSGREVWHRDDSRSPMHPAPAPQKPDPPGAPHSPGSGATQQGR